MGESPLFFALRLLKTVASLGRGLDRTGLRKQVYDIADPIAKALNLELVEVQCHGKGRGSVIRVTLDREGGIGIRDCEQFHHSLSHALDVADPVPHAYRLEVSSPGIDRPLKQLKDYQRVLGKVLRVKVQEQVQGQQIVIGRLSAVNPESVVLTVRSGKHRANEQDIELPWDAIIEAKQEVGL